MKFNLQPIDIIAAIVLIGGFILISMHIDGVVGGIVIAVVTYYFRRNMDNSKKIDEQL